jgi:hypothetical protein
MRAGMLKIILLGYLLSKILGIWGISLMDQGFSIPQEL